MTLRAKLLLADDHALVRAGLRRILDSQPDFSVVAEASDGVEAVERALAQEIDLAVLDVSMPKLTGLHAARQMLAHRSHLRVVILSMHENEEFFFEALRSGASGYVLKSAAEHDLVAACRAALRGEAFLYPAAISALVRDYLERARLGESVPDNPLSPRETEVVKLIGEGYSGRDIAGILSISEHTVERHRANVFDKLELRDRVQLTRYAIRRGLVEP